MADPNRRPTRSVPDGAPVGMSNATPDRALLTARIIWAAMFMGVAIFVGIAVKVITDAPPPAPSGATRDIMTALPFGALILLPIGYVLRSQSYKRHWVGEVVAPTGFLVGNILLFATTEAVMTMAVVSSLLLGGFWPGGAALAVGALAHLSNFPQPGVMLTEPEKEQIARRG